MVFAYPTLEKLLHLSLTTESYDLFSELLSQSVHEYLQRVKKNDDAYRNYYADHIGIEHGLDPIPSILSIDYSPSMMSVIHEPDLEKAQQKAKELGQLLHLHNLDPSRRLLVETVASSTHKAFHDSIQNKNKQLSEFFYCLSTLDEFVEKHEESVTSLLDYCAHNSMPTNHLSDEFSQWSNDFRHWNESVQSRYEACTNLLVTRLFSHFRNVQSSLLTELESIEQYACKDVYLRIDITKEGSSNEKQGKYTLKIGNPQITEITLSLFIPYTLNEVKHSVTLRPNQGNDLFSLTSIHRDETGYNLSLDYSVDDTVKFSELKVQVEIPHPFIKGKTQKVEHEYRPHLGVGMIG